MTIYELIEIENNHLFETKLFNKKDRLENFLYSRFDDDQAHYLLIFGHISFDNIEVHLYEKELS